MILIGYAITAAIYLSLALTVAFIVLERQEMKRLLAEHIDRYSLAAFALILVFFLALSIFSISPTEQLYFDENIYQGIAINILKHGSALWCQFGTGYLQNCYVNSLYHDPVGWSAFIAIAFAIFGIGTSTTYNLELAAGAASILFFFLLASVLTRRKSYAVVSTLAFALMPQLFIWSRTQGDVDLAFMMFSTLAFFLFVVFTRRRSLNSLGAFAFSLAIVAYMRIEALLLVGLFSLLMLVFGQDGVMGTLRERVASAGRVILANTRVLIMLLVFILVLFPEIYYVAGEAQSPSYGQGAGESVISLKNFQNNLGINVPFVFGQMNGVNYYPIAWHYAITPLAILGMMFLAIDRSVRNRFGILILLVGWFSAYFLFYTAFYAGAATYGVDSRFMLQLLPSVSLLAGYAMTGIGDAARNIAGRFARGNRSQKIMSAAYIASIAIASVALLVYPFALLLPVVTLPPAQMPQQSVILGSINYFYARYSSVPTSCLVFSFTPDIWVEVNRSSAQIGYLNGANSTNRNLISQYSCLVIDYGYWCVVPPYRDSLCQYLTTRYKISNLKAPEKQASGYSTGFYQVLNYT